MTVKLFTDGGARGNPGPAAAAFVLQGADGVVLDGLDQLLESIALPEDTIRSNNGEF